MATNYVEMGRQALRWRERSKASMKARLHTLGRLAKAHPKEYSCLRKQFLTDNPPRSIDFSQFSEEQLETIGRRFSEYKHRLYRRARAHRESEQI